MVVEEDRECWSLKSLILMWRSLTYQRIGDATSELGPTMSSRTRSTSLSAQRAAARSNNRATKLNYQANVPQTKREMAVINWENVLVPLDWLAVHLGLGLSNLAVDAAVTRCRSSPELLQALAAIEDRVMTLLTVFIVSEFTTAYVELVCSMFFPRLTAALRSSPGGIYVVGTPDTQLSAGEMKQWKVNLLHTAIFENFFAGVSEEVAARLLARSSSGRIKVVALCASEADVAATSAIHLIAPSAVVKRVKVPGATDRTARSPRTPVSLDEFYAQLQGLTQFVRQSTR